MLSVQMLFRGMLLQLPLFEVPLFEIKTNGFLHHVLQREVMLDGDAPAIFVLGRVLRGACR